MDEGWVKLHRKFSTWEWKQNPLMVALFVHLLIGANHEQNEWKGVIVERGQIIVGRDTLSRDTGITPQSIRTCLKKLKSTNEITIKSTNKYSIITLCNYNKYQTSKIEINQQTNQQINKQLTNNQPTTNHKQEVKNERIEERSKDSSKRTKKTSSLTDEQFMEVISSNVAYKGIDIQTSKAKCEAWCLANNRTITRRMFINWLNREKPLTGGNGHGTYGRGSTSQVAQGTSGARNLGDGQAYPVDCEVTE